MGSSAELSSRNLTGDLLALFAGLLYTGYLIAVQRARGSIQPLPLLFLASAFGALMLLPVPLLLGERVIPRRLDCALSPRARQPGARPGAAGLCDRRAAAAGRRPCVADPAGDLGADRLACLWRDAEAAGLVRCGSRSPPLWCSCACPSGACERRPSSPVEPAWTSRVPSNSCAGAWRSRSAKMRCSTAGPQGASTAPPRSSASIRSRRGWPCPRARRA